jgi:hypothetical protein
MSTGSSLARPVVLFGLLVLVCAEPSLSQPADQDLSTTYTYLWDEPGNNPSIPFPVPASAGTGGREVFISELRGLVITAAYADGRQLLPQPIDAWIDDRRAARRTFLPTGGWFVYIVRLRPAQEAMEEFYQLMASPAEAAPDRPWVQYFVPRGCGRYLFEYRARYPDGTLSPTSVVAIEDRTHAGALPHQGDVEPPGSAPSLPATRPATRR